MARIILIRHGKPLFQSQAPVSSIAFEAWIKNYNAAGICERHLPKAELTQLAQRCNAVVCSHFPRSVQSAQLLGVQRVDLSEYALREMEMPFGRWRGLKLPPKYWALVFRMLWLAGYAHQCESFQAAKVRTGNAALMLENLAKERQSLCFIGHGLLNRFIAKALLARGWTCEKPPTSDYWGYGIFEFTADEDVKKPAS